METRENIQFILDSINKKYHKWRYYFYFFYLAYFIILLFWETYWYKNLFHNGLSFAGNLLQIFWQFYIGNIAVIAFFEIVTRIKWRNYLLLKRLLIHNYQYNTNKLNSYPGEQIGTMIRAFKSILTFATICYLPIIVHYDNFSTKHGTFSGGFIILSFLTLCLAYIGILMPVLLGIRVQNIKYRFIYWMTFLKSRLVDSSVTLFLGILMILFVSITLAFLPLALNGDKTISNYIINLKKIENIDNFSTIVGVLGIWLSVIIILVGDMLKNYTRLYQSFEEYTSYQLREKLLGFKTIKIILIGFGNLGRLVAGNLLVKSFQFTEDERKVIAKNPYLNYDVVIDKAFRLRVIPRNLAIIEKEASQFEELRKDEQSGLNYGFISGQETILENLTPESRIPIESAMLALHGNGSSLPLLKDVNLENTELIINTTSDPDMGFLLQHLMERQINPEEKRPVIITTVEDSPTYSYLEAKHDLSIFPLHAAQTEGRSLGSRVFSFVKKVKDINKVKIMLLGDGKALYYSIDTFWQYCNQDKHGDKKTENKRIKKFIENNIVVVTGDETICKESKSANGNTQWEIILGDTDHYKINLVEGNPGRFAHILNALGKLAYNEKTEILLFVISNRNIMDTIRVAEQVNQAISSNKLNYCKMLISAHAEVTDIVEGLLNPFYNIAMPDGFDNVGFPCESRDFIIKKNVIISSQINAIADCLKHEHVIKEKLTGMVEEDLLPLHANGEIAICAANKPGTFCNIISRLSGLAPLRVEDNNTANGNDFDGKNAEGTNEEENKKAHGPGTPSFFYSYSFPVRSNDAELRDTFLYRGDAYLGPLQQSDLETMAIEDLKINGTTENHKEITSMMPFAWQNNVQESCTKYSQRCPVSSNEHMIHPVCGKKEGIPNYVKQYAQIKLWAGNDDVPGALALAIADFLMLARSARFEEDGRKGLINIVYESCQLCTLEFNALKRLYVQGIPYKEIDPKKRRELINTRNILAIKIKPIEDGDKEWEEYARMLAGYLNSVSSETYGLSLLDHHHFIVQNKIRKQVRAMEFAKRI